MQIQNGCAEEVRRASEDLCTSHSSLLSRADRERLIEDLVYEMLGLGPLEPLMADPTVSDILINGPYTIYVERRGKLERTDVRFRDLDHLLGIVQRIVGRVGRRIDEASPMVDAAPAGRKSLECDLTPVGTRSGRWSQSDASAPSLAGR